MHHEEPDPSPIVDETVFIAPTITQELISATEHIPSVGLTAIQEVVTHTISITKVATEDLAAAVSESDVADRASSTFEDHDDSPVQQTTTQAPVDVTDDSLIRGESSQKEPTKLLDDLEDIPVPVEKVAVTTEDLPANHESLMQDDTAHTITTPHHTTPHHP